MVQSVDGGLHGYRLVRRLGIRPLHRRRRMPEARQILRRQNRFRVQGDH
ncbi:hypothetical protein EJ640_02190 [Pseudomonas aeruginosa]|nr:hypothetical protein EKL31_19860 [Pseudomonas aeruginosa]RTB38852.1 hypothetical protein EJ655_17390 [Pseudomonas aeruginosa]RTB60264.1 hypothetical protein EJ640_02190 [Pseudomonas aeruginosa]RTB85461.1 hypothetical protein EJ641_13795 [Pseudomonas aeruginosa]